MIRVFAFVLVLLAGGQALAFDPFQQAGIDSRRGARVPLDLAFRDETGASVTLRDLVRGRPIVLAPVLHDCPNICGVTLAGLVEAVRGQSFVPGKDFTIVAFGIDPNEGPAAARESLHKIEASFPDLPTSGIHALTGRSGDIAAVTGALGYRYAWDERIGQFAHFAAVAVLTADGRLARWLYGLAPDPTDLELALTEAGKGRLGGWRDQLLLLCYQYDPETGRYGSLITWLLRLGGGLTVALMIGLIGVAVVRERRSARKGNA
ncbi:MAG: SCO family protein [Hyphomicrobiaceae bacterium]|nr:SCO family protein [Hyphomicrobiaceae bacterium]